MTQPVLLWFRQDLRLADQAALMAAVEDGPVIPVYVLDDVTPGPWKMGAAQRWWLHYSLHALDNDLRSRGSRLILRRGESHKVFGDLAKQVGATRVHALRHYEPWWRKAEAAVAETLDLCLQDGRHLAPPESVLSGSGEQYRIYSAYWRALRQKMPPPAPLAAPATIPAPERWPGSEKLKDWDLLPTAPDWSGGFDEAWHPGESGAIANLSFDTDDYETRRNMPGEEGTSRLSPHLHFGEVSPATVWHSLDDEKYHKEVAWRDFAASTILQRPDYGDAHGRERYDNLAYRNAPDDLRAWQRGRTGYPIVDAGMRQLWTSGWMHNRVRMITASFLTKHLLIDWRKGERWFWDTLVDADYSNNSVNWQWIAGTGVDANMFGRIMAPTLQSRKFEAADYIRRWVPELAGLDDDAIHDPEAAGIRPANYPPAIIGHREARERALAAGRAVRAG